MVIAGHLYGIAEELREDSYGLPGGGFSGEDEVLCGVGGGRVHSDESYSGNYYRNGLSIL